MHQAVRDKLKIAQGDQEFDRLFRMRAFGVETDPSRALTGKMYAYEQRPDWLRQNYPAAFDYIDRLTKTRMAQKPLKTAPKPAVSAAAEGAPTKGPLAPTVLEGKKLTEAQAIDLMDKANKAGAPVPPEVYQQYPQLMPKSMRPPPGGKPTGIVGVSKPIGLAAGGGGVLAGELARQSDDPRLQQLGTLLTVLGGVGLAGAALPGPLKTGLKAEAGQLAYRASRWVDPSMRLGKQWAFPLYKERLHLHWQGT